MAATSAPEADGGAGDFKQPPGFHELDTSIFRVVHRLKAVKLPAPNTGKAMAIIKRRVFSAPKFTNVLHADGDTARMILLAPAPAGAAGAGAAASAGAGAAAAERSHGLSAEELGALAALGGELMDADVETGYDNMGAEEVLRSLLPPGASYVPASFEAIGGLAHLNLRPEVAPWKYSIGRVLLDKNPSLRCVVNKVGAIDSTFRTFPMEVLASRGPPSTEVEIRHAGARFRLDFARVYWNTRLAGEHERVAARIVRPGAVVADMFAGVGPFAVPLALPGRGCTVHANDLNPASHAALVANAARNRVAGRLHAYNMDGRAFIEAVCAGGVPFQYALMNLPADGIAFTDVFVGCFARGDAARAAKAAAGGAGAAGAGAAAAAAPLTRPLPYVICYCFSKTHTTEDAAADTARRLLTRLRLLRPTSTAAAAAAAGSASAAEPVPFRPLCYDDIGHAVLRARAARAAANGGVEVSDEAADLAEAEAVVAAAEAAPAAAGGDSDSDDDEAGEGEGEGGHEDAGAASASGAGSAAATATAGAGQQALKFRSSVAKAAVPAPLLLRAAAARAAVYGYARALLPDLQVREVRNVAPNKVMMAAQFTLPAFVAYARGVPSPCDAAAAVAAAGPGPAMVCSAEQEAAALAAAEAARAAAMAGGPPVVWAEELPEAHAPVKAIAAAAAAASSAGADGGGAGGKRAKESRRAGSGAGTPASAAAAAGGADAGAGAPSDAGGVAASTAPPAKRGRVGDE